MLQKAVLTKLTFHVMQRDIIGVFLQVHVHVVLASHESHESYM